MKRKDVIYILDRFNSFHPNLKSTGDTFKNLSPNLLGLEIHPNEFIGFSQRYSKVSPYNILNRLVQCVDGFQNSAWLVSETQILFQER